MSSATRLNTHSQLWSGLNDVPVGKRENRECEARGILFSPWSAAAVTACDGKMEWGIMHAKRPPRAHAQAGCSRSVIVHREIWVCFALRAIFSATLIRLVLMGALSSHTVGGAAATAVSSRRSHHYYLSLSLSLSLPLQFSFSGLIIRAGTGYIIVHDITIPGLGRVVINLWIRSAF